MIILKMKLYNLTETWRSTGRKTRLASVEITNLLARGHMNGLSDGYDLAAADVDSLLNESENTVDPKDRPE